MSERTDKNQRISTVFSLRFVIPLLLLACGGIGLTVLLFNTVRDWEQDEIRDNFRHEAIEFASAIERNIDYSFFLLESLHSFYAGSEEVTRDEFHIFVEPFLTRLSGIQAVEWIPRVPDSQRLIYEQRAREDGFAGFQITERQRQGRMVGAERRDEYFPVYFVEPYEGNELALGFDLTSEQRRLEALNLSRDTGKTVATARIRLVQEVGSQHGFLVFEPVYKKGLPNDTVEQRCKNLKGFFLGVFRVGDIVESALGYLEPKGIDVYVFDQSAQPDENLLYFHSSSLREKPISSVSENKMLAQTGIRYSRDIEVAGRKWSIWCIPAPQFMALHKSWQGLAVLAGGLVSTGFVMVYLWLVLLGAKRAREYAAAQSAARNRLEEEITERERADEALRESEEKWRSLVENAPDIIMTVERDGTIGFVNRIVPSITATVEETVGTSVYDYTPAEDHGKIVEAIEEVFETGCTTGYETSVAESTGATSWYSARVGPIKRDGKVVAVTLVATDVTEHKRAEKALKESEERYRALFQGAAEGIIVADVETKRFKYANPALCEMLGYSKEELEQMGVSDVHPKEVLEYVVSEFEAQARGEKALSPAVPCLQKNGTIIYADIDTARVLIDARECNVGFFTNVTERKRAEEALQKAHDELEIRVQQRTAELGNAVEQLQREVVERRETEKLLRESEERYRAIFEQAADSIVLFDAETGEMVEFNDKTCQTLGYSREEFRKLKIPAFEVSESAKDVARHIKKIVKGDSDAFESRHRTKDGRILDILVSARAINVGGRKFIQGIWRDITERKRAEERLLVYQGQLRSLASELSLSEERVKRRMATDVHDNIGQNLAMAKIKLESLGKSVLSAGLAESLAEISQLIAQAIESTRTLTFELSPPVLYELGLGAALEWLVRNMRTQHGVSAEFNDDGQSKPLEHNILVLLFQAVRELLVNVAKHAQAHRVIVSARRIGDSIHISVEDDGVGFDTSHARYEGYESEGFGLFSIRERLSHLGGHLDVESRAGQGTVATLVAPIGCDDENDKEKK